MLQMKPVEQTEFHGGITDNYINTQPHKYQTGDNFIVTTNKKLYTRNGSDIKFASLPQIPSGATRINSLMEHKDDLLIQSVKNVYFANDAEDTWNTLVGPVDSNPVLTTGDADSIISYAKGNNHLYITNSDFTPIMKIYEDGSAVRKVRNAGLPALASSPSGAGTAGASTFLYAFLYYFTYDVGTVTFEDYGAETKISVASVDAPDVNSITLSSIPVISNSTTDNYDTTNIKVKIYRTQAGGSSYTYVGEVTNGTTSYVDSSSDATIVTNTALYTDDGTLANTSPPLAKYIHIVAGKCYYAHIKSGSEILESRVLESKIEDFDSVPAANFASGVTDSITGLSSVGDLPIVACDRSLYRLEGGFDDFGVGSLVAKEIDNSVGCISHNSIVQVTIGGKSGIVFASWDGFYFCDGYNTLKISIEINETYKDLVSTAAQRRRIYGAYDDETNRVWWSVQTSSAGASDVDKCYILDLNWGIKPDSCFTTASGGTSFAPSALLFMAQQLHRADKRGYIFYHDNALASDPRVDTAVAAASWDTQTIIWNWKSGATNFESSMYRKWVTWCIVQAYDESNVSIQINSFNDLGGQKDALKPIRYRANIAWGDQTILWGDSTVVWGFVGLVEEKRRFSAGFLRCSYKQIEVTNAYVIVIASDDLGTATVDATLKTATLDDAATYNWPTDILDYYISFDNDDYAQEYPVTVRTNDVITFTDTVGRAVAGSHKWHIKGYPKDEILNLLGISIHYDYLGKTQKVYTGATGENA